MTARAEGRRDWEFEEPSEVGAIPRFVAEVRGAIESVSPDAQGAVADDMMIAAFKRMRDAFKALKESAKDEPVNG